MANPSKAKGTAAESAVVKFARANGFGRADRLTLSGRYDRGDVDLTGDRRIVIEVKAYATYSDAMVMLWLGDTERERLNAGAEYAFLVVKRAGKGTPEHWWAVELEDVAGTPRPVYRYLSDHLVRLRLRGFGEVAA